MKHVVVAVVGMLFFAGCGAMQTRPTTLGEARTVCSRLPIGFPGASPDEVFDLLVVLARANRDNPGSGLSEDELRTGFSQGCSESCVAGGCLGDCLVCFTAIVDIIFISEVFDER